MFAPFIIDQVRQREEARRRNVEQPRVELPLDIYRPRTPSSHPPDVGDGTSRGVIIVDLHEES